jgi:hypothetical protein
MSGDSIAIGVAYRDQNLIGSTLTDCIIAGTTTDSSTTTTTGAQTSTGTSTTTGVPTANGRVFVNTTATSTTPGSVRAIQGSVTQAATTTTGTVVGVRGVVTATTAMSNFAYGTQGKIVLDGVTVTAGSSHVCGVLAQISGSAATFTSGHIAALICSGQTLPASAGTTANMIYCESGGSKINACLESNVAANYFMSINNFENCGIVATSAGGTIGANPKKIKILVDNVAKYFVCADDWS